MYNINRHPFAAYPECLPFSSRLRGSYEKLHYGLISEAFVDLTGGVQFEFNLGNLTDHLFEIMKTAALSGCLMACTTPQRVSLQRLGSCCSEEILRIVSLKLLEKIL